MTDRQKFIRHLTGLCKIITAFSLPNLLESIKLVESVLANQEKDFLRFKQELTDSPIYLESYTEEHHLIKNSRETIRMWLFVACYSQFEGNLITVCKHIAKSCFGHDLPKKRLNVYAAKNYLSEVGFKFLDSNEDWLDLFEGYRLTRNLIVHNSRRLDKWQYDQWPNDARELKDFIDETPTIIFDAIDVRLTSVNECDPSQYGTIRLSESFCQDFIHGEERLFRALSSEMEKLFRLDA